MSGWYRSTARADDVAADAADAVAAAMGPPGCVATLVLPADASWSESTHRARARRGHGAGRASCRPTPSTRWPRRCAAASGPRSSSAGSALRADGLHAASRVAATAGAALLGETFPANLERGAGIPAVDRLAYLAEMAQAQLDGVRHLVLVDAKSPVSFFAYPDKASDLVPAGCTVHTLARPGEDAAGALEALAEALGAPGDAGVPAPAGRPDRPTGAVTTETLAAAVGATLPEGAIVVDEGNTSGLFVAGRDGGRAPARLADPHRRRHRHRPAHGHRRRGGGAGAPGPLPAGGRQRHVHAAGAVDPGPRGPERDDGRSSPTGATPS